MALENLSVLQISLSTVKTDILVTVHVTGRYNLVGSDVAWESRGTAIDPRVRHIFSWRFGLEIISMAILRFC